MIGLGALKEWLMQIFGAPERLGQVGSAGTGEIEQVRREIETVDRTVDAKLAAARAEGQAVTDWTVGIARAQHTAARHILSRLAAEAQEIEHRFGWVRPGPRR